MIELYNKETKDLLGEISQEDLQFLIDNLEEENLTDTDYYINRPVLDMLKEKGLSSDLSCLIEKAMGESDDVEIEYKKVD